MRLGSAVSKCSCGCLAGPATGCSSPSATDLFLEMVCGKTIGGGKVPGTWDRGLLDERARCGGELQVLSAAKSSLCGCFEGIG